MTSCTNEKIKVRIIFTASHYFFIILPNTYYWIDEKG